LHSLLRYTDSPAFDPKAELGSAWITRLSAGDRQ